MIIHALIMHVRRPLKLVKCLRYLMMSSKLANTPVKIVVLQQGIPGPTVLRILKAIMRHGHTVIMLGRNIGIGPGRELLKRIALMDGCEAALYLDNDIYFNHAALKAGVEALRSGYDLVGFPQLSPSGRLVSPGGYNIEVKGGVIIRSWPISKLSPGRIVEVNGVNAGCMLCSLKALRKMIFGPYMSGFDDLEKTLSTNDLKQCVVSIPVIHDRDEAGAYARIRYSKEVLRDSYVKFISRTGLRLQLKDHLYYLSPPYAYVVDLLRHVIKALPSPSKLKS